MSDDLNDRHDPEWLAQRYVLGELDDADAAAFEERLATDETAAAALAAAVRLLGAVEATRPAAPVLPTAPAPLPRGLPAAPAAENRGGLIAGRGAAIGAIVTATALSALLFLDPAALRRPAADPAAPRTEASREIALAADVDADEPPESDDVPEWLLAAVALEADGAGPVREN